MSGVRDEAHLVVVVGGVGARGNSIESGGNEYSINTRYQSTV
jgi:hypothetical protein